jgi:hypothetical protein
MHCSDRNISRLLGVPIGRGRDELHGFDGAFRGPTGARLRTNVIRAAKEFSLPPALLAVNGLSETYRTLLKAPPYAMAQPTTCSSETDPPASLCTCAATFRLGRAPDWTKESRLAACAASTERGLKEYCRREHVLPQRVRRAMRRILVVDDRTFQSLTPIIRTAALKELKRLFDFVGRRLKEKAISLTPLVPSSFPERFDLSDSVVRLIDSDVFTVQTSIRQQHTYVSARLKALGITLSSGGRVAGTPDRLGFAMMLKHVAHLPSRAVAVVLMASEVSVPGTAKDFVENSTQDRRTIERRRNFGDDLGRMTKYYASHQSLRDTYELMLLNNPETPSKWPEPAQQRFGIVLGRTMAHEVRHLYVADPSHAGAGLGTSSPDALDDRNYGNFSSDDQDDIVKALQTFDRNQTGATVIPTFPKEVRSKPDSFPF